MGLNLLEKTELWINNITLNKSNLTLLAETVAGVLKIEKSKVLVVDVRSNHITLDILEKDIPEEKIIGKEKKILEAISEINGVFVTEDTYIHSNGILGLICLDENNSVEMKNTISKMVNEIKYKISKRAIVFPTGFELVDGLIEDTNTPYLKQLLENEGYKVDVGDIIRDEIYDVVNKLSDAVSKAYGLIITTGGVGAEDKDKMVEGVLRIDPDAASPYIVKFQQGTGRHVKDGVKIAVGSVGPSLIVSMPGPNDEVKIASSVLLHCIKNNCNKQEIAQQIAGTLAGRLADKKFNHDKNHNKEVLNYKKEN